MNLSKFVEYVKVHATWKNKPDKSTPVDAASLMKIESGIKANNDAIKELAAAVVNQIANDPDKIASMAALYAVNQKVDQQNSDLALCEYKTITYTSLFDSHGLSYSVRINKIVYAHLAFVTNSAVPANADICQLINTGSMEAITNIAYKSAKGTTGTFKVDSARAQNLRTDGNLVSGEAFVIDIILRIK